MISVVMTTYVPKEGKEREDYAFRSLFSLFNFLKAPEPLQLHVADDCSYDTAFIYKMMDEAGRFWRTASSHTITSRAGIGGSLNLAVRQIYQNDPDTLWLYTTDDWVLTEKLNIAQAVDLIRNFGYDLVRLGPVHPNLVAETKFCQGVGWWWELSNKQGFAFATRPFLANKNLFNKLGAFPERLNAYDTERIAAERISQASVRLAITGEVKPAGPWEHIGEYEVGTLSL